MRRHLLGTVALLLILAGMAGMFADFSNASPTGIADAAGVSLRAGLMLGALWIAYPQLVQLAKRFPRWLYAIIGAVAALFAFGPRSLVIIIPALIILAIVQVVAWLFKPLPKKRIAKKEKQEHV